MKRERSPASPGIDPAFVIGVSLPAGGAHFPAFAVAGEEKSACMVAKPIVVSGDEGISVKFD